MTLVLAARVAAVGVFLVGVGLCLIGYVMNAKFEHQIKQDEKREKARALQHPPAMYVGATFDVGMTRQADGRHLTTEDKSTEIHWTTEVLAVSLDNGNLQFWHHNGKYGASLWGYHFHDTSAQVQDEQPQQVYNVVFTTIVDTPPTNQHGQDRDAGTEFFMPDAGIMGNPDIEMEPASNPEMPLVEVEPEILDVEILTYEDPEVTIVWVLTTDEIGMCQEAYITYHNKREVCYDAPRPWSIEHIYLSSCHVGTDHCFLTTRQLPPQVDEGHLLKWPLQTWWNAAPCLPRGPTGHLW